MTNTNEKPPLNLSPVKGDWESPKPLASLLEGCQHLELDAKCLLPAPGNPEVTLEDITASGLLASLDAEGQLDEVLVYRHPNLADMFYVPDGNHRVCGLRHLGRKVKACLLSKPPTDDDLDTLWVALATTSKKPDRGLTGLKMFTWRTRVETRTDADVVEHFKFSPGYVSKLLAPFKNGIPELVQALKDRQIVPTAAPFVASLPHEVQREILPKVIGKKRSAVQSICDGYKKPKAKREGKPFRAIIGGVTLSAREATPDKLVSKLVAVRDRLSEALKSIEKDPRLLPAVAQLVGG